MGALRRDGIPGALSERHLQRANLWYYGSSRLRRTGYPHMTVPLNDVAVS